MYLIARGPEPHRIATSHEDESLDWELTIASMGSSPKKVPTRPAHIRREVREWLSVDSQSFREANARGEPLTPFPPTPQPPTPAQREAALKATAMRKARERSYEPGRLGTGAAGGYLEVLRGLIGDGRSTTGGVGHKGVPRVLRDAFLAERHYREHRERAGSLEEWIRSAASERLNFYASPSFQDEMLAISCSLEIRRGTTRQRRARTSAEAEAIARTIKAERLSVRRFAAAILASPRGRGPGVKNRKEEIARSRRGK